MIAETRKIRNVVLLGHSGCGKTTFAETMLYEAGAISRRGSVQEANTVSDYTEIEKTKGNSIFTTLMHTEWRNGKINILDTPGLDDFVGEVISSLKVADTGVMLLNAGSGVEVGTELIWEYIVKFGTSAFFIVNQLDHDKSDFENTLEQAINRFGNKVIPFQYPLNEGSDFNTIVDALRMVMYVFPKDGGKPEKREIPDSEISRAQQMHNAIVEAAAENDEALMELFFDHGSLSEEEIAKGLTIAISKQQIFPVFCASAVKNMGSGRIMGFINDICPSPADKPEAGLADGETLKCDAGFKTSIFIYKTLTEPNVGNVSYFKVYSGTLKTGDELINAKNGNTERFSHLYVANGKIREAVPKLLAGDIGVAVKLKDAHTNNTLNEKGVSRSITPIDFPHPNIRIAVNAPNKNEVEKVARALHQIQEEDPTAIVEHSAELKQILLYGQGQLHLDLIKYRIEKVYDLDIHFEKPKIPYRETITRSSDEVYRHKKQSGGAGQFAEVHMRVEPYYDGIPDPSGLSVRNSELEDLKSGGKLSFLWCIVGGSIDAKFSNAIKKGVMMKMEEGPLTGSPCQNIRVAVYDGKMHPVDSNDMAFQIAGSLAFKQAFENAAPQLLEPIHHLTVLCDPEFTGDVMGDLQTRRAIIMGMDTEGHYQKISARIPLSELDSYSIALRAITQGKAKFNSVFAEYAAVNPDIQHQLVQSHKEELTAVGHHH
jgi:elongation factor G